MKEGKGDEEGNLGVRDRGGSAIQRGWRTCERTHLPTHNPCRLSCGMHDPASSILRRYSAVDASSPSCIARSMSSLDMA